MHLPRCPAVLVLILSIAAIASFEGRARSVGDDPKADDSVSSAEAKKNEEKPVALDRVEVLGSRIHAVDGAETAFPVLVLNRVDLERRGVTRLADIRWAISQLGASTGFNDNLAPGPSPAQQRSTSYNL